MLCSRSSRMYLSVSDNVKMCSWFNSYYNGYLKTSGLAVYEASLAQ